MSWLNPRQGCRSRVISALLLIAKRHRGLLVAEVEAGDVEAVEDSDAHVGAGVRSEAGARLHDEPGVADAPGVQRGRAVLVCEKLRLDDLDYAGGPGTGVELHSPGGGAPGWWALRRIATLNLEP